MKATLEFNFPDDNLEYRQCNSARDMAMALWDISNLWTKHNRPKSVDACLKRIKEILEENNINLDETIR